MESKMMFVVSWLSSVRSVQNKKWNGLSKSSGSLMSGLDSRCRKDDRVRRLNNRKVCTSLSSGENAFDMSLLNEFQRSKLDTNVDDYFYDYPRMVNHVDDSFRQQLTMLYRQKIPENGVVLDLCSSWISHLPEDGRLYKSVIGHGMNKDELKRNRALSGGFFVQNLNELENLKRNGIGSHDFRLDDSSFDAVLICVSIQYIQYPELVFSEIHRVLKRGGVVVISFSNRMFYNKAIQVWRDGSSFQRINLVRSYFRFLGESAFSEPEVIRSVVFEQEEKSNPPSVFEQTTKMIQQFLSSIDLFGNDANDPFFAIVAEKL